MGGVPWAVGTFFLLLVKRTRPEVLSSKLPQAQTRQLTSGSCAATCGGYDCNFFVANYDWTCAELEAGYGCDCSGCNCPNYVAPTSNPTLTLSPTTAMPTSEPTLTLSPTTTMGPPMTTVTTFSNLASASTDGAYINVAEDITFANSVAISGTVSLMSSTGAALDGNGSTRLFKVGSGGALTLSFLTLRDGKAIYIYGETYSTNGGAIYISGGTLTASGCIFTVNRANYDGGAVYVSGGAFEASDCSFTSNSAEFGGAVYVSDGGTFTASGSSFSSNQASAGVDIYLETVGTSSGVVDCDSECFEGSGTCGEVGCFSCTCYSCDCAYPSSLPTPFPSPFPTPLPTTQTPTPAPTPSPTPTTVISLIPPDALSLVATKPSSASESVYVVNLNAETLTGSIRLSNTSLPQRSAWSATPSTFSIAPGAFATVLISIQSPGLNPQTYGSNSFQITARTDNSLPINSTLDVALTIRTKADHNTSKVRFQGAPTIDDPWDQVWIEPFDSDGFAIATDGGENFQAKLSSGRILTADCSVSWSAKDDPPCYRASCDVPNANQAGIWNLTVSLDDKTFFSTTVRVKCGVDSYEDQDAMCARCPSGTTCDTPGATLLALPLDSGYWRSGESHV